MKVPEEIEILRNKIKEYAVEAVKCEKLEIFDRAYEFYIKASEVFLILIKKDPNIYAKKIYIDKAREYLNRSKKIKEKVNKELENQIEDLIEKEKPNIKWEEVAGLEKAKKFLKIAAIFPIKFPQLFQGKRKTLKTILLYGPPGTGKRHLVKAVATEADSNFISLNANIINKYKGEPEILIKGIFDLARKKKSSVIFLDKIDSIMSAKSENDYTRRIKAEFMVQIDDMIENDENILVLGTTNNPWELDPFVIKKFEKKIYIPLPKLDERIVLFEINLKDVPNTITEEQMEDLAKKTEGCSIRDILILSQDAIFKTSKNCQNKFPGEFGNAGKEESGTLIITESEMSEPKGLLLSKVNYDDFIVALKNLQESNFGIGKSISKFEEFTRKFGQEG